jgi:hypothetical protein
MVNKQIVKWGETRPKHVKEHRGKNANDEGGGKEMIVQKIRHK